MNSATIDKLTVLNEYPGSHHYFETYEREPDMYCPRCGTKGSLWTALDGDYYAGPTSVCVSCASEGHLRGGMSSIKEPNMHVQLRQLIDGKAMEPTTRRGT
jgi:hypothetical protein